MKYTAIVEILPVARIEGGDRCYLPFNSVKCQTVTLLLQNWPSDTLGYSSLNQEYAILLSLDCWGFSCANK